MRIYTRIVIDMKSLEVFERDGYNHSGPIEECKGDQTASNTEKAQGGFTNTLQQAFTSNNAAQQDQLNFLSAKLKAGVSNPQGFSPETLAAMRTQATEQAALENKNAVQAVQSKEATQGGPTALPSGVDAQIRAQVATDASKANNDAQLAITEQNGQLQNDNQWKAVQAEQGIASLENPTGMAGVETGSANAVTGLSEAVTKANGPGWGSILGGVVGAGLGAAGSYFGKKAGN